MSRTAKDLNRLDVYSWADTGVAGVTPLVWAHHRNEHNGEGGYHDARDPHAEAARVAPTLLERPERDRAMLIQGIGVTADGIYKDGPAQAWTVGPDVEDTRQWCEAFFASLRAAGLKRLAHVALDFEDAASYWTLGAAGGAGAFLARLRADAGRWALARKRLPREVAALPAGQGDDWPSEAVVAHERAAAAQRDAALSEAVARPLAAAMAGTPLSSSHCVALADPADAPDANGWPRPAGPRLGFGSHACEYLYLSVGGRSSLAAGRQPHEDPLGEDDELRLSLAWHDDRRLVRECLRAGVPAAHWYGPPSYGLRGPDDPMRAARSAAWAEALKSDVAAISAAGHAPVVLLWGDVDPAGGPGADSRWGAADLAALAAVVPQLQTLAADGPVPPALIAAAAAASNAGGAS